MHDLARPMVRALQLANSVSTGYSAGIIPQLARPTGDGVIDLSQDGAGRVPHRVKVMGVGVGSGGNTMGIRVWGWNQILAQGANPPLSMWVPTLLSDATYTLGSTVGVANGIVPATERLAVSLALVADPTQVNQTGTFGESIYVNPIASFAAMLIVELFGSQLIQFDCKTTASVTSANAIFGLL